MTWWEEPKDQRETVLKGKSLRGELVPFHTDA